MFDFCLLSMLMSSWPLRCRLFRVLTSSSSFAMNSVFGQFTFYKRPCLVLGCWHNCCRIGRNEFASTFCSDLKHANYFPLAFLSAMLLLQFSSSSESSKPFPDKLWLWLCLLPGFALTPSFDSLPTKSRSSQSALPFPSKVERIEELLLSESCWYWR